MPGSNISASHRWIGSVGLFLRADSECLRDWVAQRQRFLLSYCVVTIVVGAGAYGAVMGCWRDALQGLYTGIKFPLVILLTTLGNGLLNGMLAPLLGLNVTFRQSLMIVLMSFSIASVILGALSPVALFVVWNTPSLLAVTRLSSPEYGFLQLTHVVFIAFAGTIGNVRLMPLLMQWSQPERFSRRRRSPSPPVLRSSVDVTVLQSVATAEGGRPSPPGRGRGFRAPPITSPSGDLSQRGRSEFPLLGERARVRASQFSNCIVPAQNASIARNVLAAWLAGNLFLGSQIAWVLRPFIWDPARPIEFIGREYFRGSFFETIFAAFLRLFFS